MDPGLSAELIRQGPIGLVALLCLIGLSVVWGLYRGEATARQSEGKLAADALMEQRILNVKSEAGIDRRDDRIAQRDDRIAQLERELHRCEQEIDRWRSQPRKEAPS